MRKSKRNQNFFVSFFKQFFHWLTRLVRGVVNGLREFFIADLEQDTFERSPKSEGFNDENFDHLNFDHLNNDVIIVNRPKPFLLGLEDLPNLDVMTTKDLIGQINWKVESSEIQVAKEEDLTLLEDLLANFPES
ncbi:hypothetical protein H6F42_16620 [Pseudanabaena sp. FACHB-1998]|uniref:hypothetical protein n=1 Tax=Pseudanabaena sp. FACHB-1998 TaxID=2692858 RepID=UPI0016816EF5|nr:hypothetical protein [Pseudanabaena sp. FACHB-1998]MBD2178542.1 hypothetical protein [Pseudanabaena sp. FACHB-1998]